MDPFLNNIEYRDKVLVLARTLMKNNRVCIGGVLLSNNRYIRLLDLEEKNVMKSEPYQIGEIYDIHYFFRQNIIPPHIEDVIISYRKFFRKMLPAEFFAKINTLNLRLGCIKNLFEQCLNWNERKGFLTRQNIPKNGSVLITSLDYNLIKFENNKYLSAKIDNLWHYIPYVGEYLIQDSFIIPKGTLIRFSIARWWTGHNHTDSNGFVQERAYLQISGFYNNDTYTVPRDFDLIDF